MAMSSTSNVSYERLKHESWFDEDNKEIRDKIIGKYMRKIRLSRVHIRRKRKVKVPSLMKFLKRKTRLVKVALKKVYKRLKEGRSHFGDLFAGNYLFMQVTPTPLKYSENSKSFVKGKDQLHGFSPSPSALTKLDYDSKRQLALLFNQAGVVEISEVIYNRQTDQSRGFGFVTMSSVEEAENAVEMFNRYGLNGRLLTVNKASPVGSQPERVPKLHEAAFRIYIGNLPWQVDNARLEQVFREHGKVIDARVVCDRETGRSRGFGFVTMSTETEVNDAITALVGLNLEGRAIRVNIAEERPRHSF